MAYGLHSDIDGDLHLHSNDPDSDSWLVEAIWPPSTEFEVCEHTKNWSTYGVTHARNAWYVHLCSTIRITDGAGNTTEHTVHSYPAIRSGDWDWPQPSVCEDRPIKLNRAPWGVRIRRAVRRTRGQ